MDVLNKFYSTVSNTVSQFSSVLPGNPLTREYEVSEQVGSAGPGLLWKIYDGYKKSTKQEASIFVCEKRQLVPQDRESILEALRRGVSQLTKLRHPQVLVVQHPLEESRDCLAFATEPVFASLANVLGRNDNLPPNCSHLKNHNLYDVEIKYGLLQIGEGLAFLHKDAKIIHRNICPSSIIVNKQGAWKIFGFDFAAVNISTESTPKWAFTDFRKCDNNICQPDLNYLAPEFGPSETQSPASDIYSLGVLIYAVFNNGQTLVPQARDWFTFTSNIPKMKSVSPNKLNSVADGLRDLVRMMLSTTPELRPDEHDFIKSGYFEDVCVKALTYMDSLFQWDNRQKSQFYKGLPQIIEKLPHRVNVHRVIPSLVKEFVNPMMVPFVLPNIFLIAENSNKEEFGKYILPYLKPVMTIQDPIQVLLIFMQKMDLLLKLTSEEEIKVAVLPLLYRALESNSPDIQELCLSILPSSVSLIDFPSMKNALLPRIKKVCVSTTSISVRVNCLISLGKLLDNLDKWLVLDDVLPFLPKIPSKEPAVLMGILGIYKLVLNHKKMTISKDMMATNVIPFLMPLCIENTLSLNQFNALISVVKDMVARVEDEHRGKLEQLHAVHQEQQSFEASLHNSMAVTPEKSSSHSVGPSMKELEELFGIESKPIASVPAAPVVKPNTPQLTSSIPSAANLTFQDKKRIMAESDATKRMVAAGPLTPSPAAFNKPNHQPKDLTADLIGKNMMGLSQGSGTSQNAGGKLTLSKPQSGMIVNRTSQSNNDPPEWNWGDATVSSNQKVSSNRSKGPPMSSMQNSPNGWAPWNNQAFSPVSNSQSSTKPLSPSEINDFLS